MQPADTLVPVLSIDFDYWAEPTEPPEVLDWGFRETLFNINQIWGIRAADLFARGKDPLKAVRLAHNEPEPYEMLDELRKRGASFGRVALAESHAPAADWLACKNREVELFHVDAHHDMGYGNTKNDCSDWVKRMVDAGTVGRIYLIYPGWRTHVGHQETTAGQFQDLCDHCANKGVKIAWYYGVDLPIHPARFRKTFLCRSGAWVPPWLDDHWCRMVWSLLRGAKNTTIFNYDSLEGFNREFDIEGAKQTAEVMQKSFEGLNALGGKVDASK